MSLKYFSNAHLKIMAILFMVIDHIAFVLLSNTDKLYLMMRLIGRLSFPIFAFLIAEGFFYTKNVKKYITRLSIFALLSEIPYDLVFNQTWFEIRSQNVFLTLLLGLIAIRIFDKYRNQDIYLSYISLILFVFLSMLLRTDYNFAAILMIFIFYYFRGHFLKISINIILINTLLVILSLNTGNSFEFIQIIQLFAVLSLFFIYFYNHKKGYQMKYLFYIFYPVHLLILYFIELNM